MKIAVCYFGLLRSLKKVYKTHIDKIFNELTQNGITYDIFLHSWKTENNIQYVWEDTIDIRQDYEIPKEIDNKIINKCFEHQCDFMSSIDFSKYFYEDEYKKYGERKEWRPQLIKNHLCALESMKRVLNMVKNSENGYNGYNFVMLLRPDVQINNKLHINQIKTYLINNNNGICIPKYDSYEGYNDRFAIMNVCNADKFFERIDEIIDFRKTNGRIVSEKYTKFIVDKYYKVNLIDFQFKIIRP